ncbi:hypothetical protein PEBR_32050 [Penicillium brasilianum]|uniref:GPI anchored serine-threonine rich protein n=1 Tax=Penicillium brasilianum TaxID=104259 RepID=A0A1S9RG65_PENBI|nr:hypothetical protein PEBR_32050 [Penicillium brasilianum]
MRFIATKLPLLLAASATIVVGESTTTGSGSVSTSSTKCAAQKVVDQCVQNMRFELENCGTYDWDCQCIGSTNVVKYVPNPIPVSLYLPTLTSQLHSPSTFCIYLTWNLLHSCYNNCPELPERIGAQTIRQQNCANAKAYDTTTTHSTPSSTAGFDSPSSSPVSSSFASDSTDFPSGLKETSDEATSSSSSSEPTKSLTGLEATASASSGAAAGAVKAAGGWVAFLGLALGVLF